MEQKVKVIIIDEEEAGRERLKALLQQYFPDLELMAEAATLASGKEAIAVHAPDIVFLDIEMENTNGFQLFKDFPERNFEIIITTANDQHALRAIKASALDYILKPVTVEALQIAIKKFLTERSKNTQLPRELIDAWGLDLKNIEQIALPTLDGYAIIDTKEILYAKADGSYTAFFLTSNKKLTISRNLKEYEDLLKSSGFFRIHHSFLVNVAHVRKYTRGKASGVELTDGTQLEVAVRRRDDFLKVLNSM